MTRSFLIRWVSAIAFNLFSLIFIPGLEAQIIQRTSIVNLPLQITAEPDPLEYATVSEDGRYLAYSARKGKFTDLWLRSADPAVVMLPRRLTEDPAEEASPIFSPDGRFLAYVGTGYDVKGDIYLLDLHEKNPVPHRLTGRETEDGAPCFSREGNRIYFHQKHPGDPNRKIAFLDILPGKPFLDSYPIHTLSLDIDAAFPALSRDGSQIAFITYHFNPSGNICIYNLKNMNFRRVTSGRYLDFFPTWSHDGKHLLFARYAYDTNNDGILNYRDNAAIFRIRVDEDDPVSYPLTSARFSSSQPVSTVKGFYFLTNRKKVSNSWFLPKEGEIPLRHTPADQVALSARIAISYPRDPYLILAAEMRILEMHSIQADAAAAAAYRIGEMFQKLREFEEAVHWFQWIQNRYPEKNPEAAMSALQVTLIRSVQEIQSESNDIKRARILHETISRIEDSIQGKDPFTATAYRIEAATLIVKFSGQLSEYQSAIRFLDEVIKDPSSFAGQTAHALVIKGDLLSKIGEIENARQIYLTILKDFQTIEPWMDTALARLLDFSVSNTDFLTSTDPIQNLRKVADDNRILIPALSMGALIRIGDLYYEAGEWGKAKSAYAQVIEQFPAKTRQTVAARFALAEILFKEERFRQALDLYENEIRERPEVDDIYQLARKGYIRKSIDSGKYLLRLGEVHSARKIFREIMETEYNSVEAHKGYIQCAALQKEVHPLLKSYRTRIKMNPLDSVALYAAGLCLTYLEDRKSLGEARRLVNQAIALDGQVEFYHQTLGYIHEALETVFQVPNQLEPALDAYQKAYFLNDPTENPSSHSDLLLNLGNVYFLLGQNAKAFYYFSERMKTRAPFLTPGAAIMFYRRLGMSSFQVKDAEKSIQAFQNALSIIDQDINNPGPSRFLDSNHRYLMDRILPSLNRKDRTTQKGKEIAGYQSELNQILFTLTQNYAPPPSSGWKEYKTKIGELINRQIELNRKTLEFVKQFARSDSENPEEMRLILSVMTAKARESLLFLEKMAAFKVEILDRLGLAYQEKGEFGKGIKTFESAFSLNYDLGNQKNLAKNKRSIAFNRYQHAIALSGKEKNEELQKAKSEFLDVLSLLDRYGVPESVEKESNALKVIGFNMTIDEGDTTFGGKGFSKEQEKRLAEAFIQRIGIELGDLIQAENALKHQLAFYGYDRKISDRDAFGVSLLHHRAGHLQSALGNWEIAIKYFRESAILSLQIKNAANAAVSIMNLAKAVSLLSGNNSLHAIFHKDIERLDSEILNLFSQPSIAPSKSVRADYHNTMGVYFVSRTRGRASKATAAVADSWYLQKGSLHFASGIRLMENGEMIPKRKEMALLSSLYLNFASAANRLGDTVNARSMYEKSLTISMNGLLPDIQWRALIGLGRLEDALSILESTTFLRAGCQKGEIIYGLGEKALELIRQNRIEEAFNWVERVSEAERYHRTAAFINSLTETEKNLFRESADVLGRIDALTKEISSTQDQSHNFLREQARIAKERLESLLGKDRENLPQFLRSWNNQKIQETGILLAGMAAEAEALADRYVESKDQKTLLVKYQGYIESYRKLRESFHSQEAVDPELNLIHLFGPKAMEAVDVMEVLSDKELFLRVFPFQSETILPRQRLAFFSMNQNRISVSLEKTLSEGISKIETLSGQRILFAYDFPEELSIPEIQKSGPISVLLNAAHFKRSSDYTNPFKRTILYIPAQGSIHREEFVFENASFELESDKASKGIHTLILASPIFESRRIPTRQGESGSPSLYVSIQNGKRMNIFELLSRLSQTSLSILPGAPAQDPYLIGHLFSIFGCPTVILSPTSKPVESFVRPFLKRYASQSIQEAFLEIRSGETTGSDWFILGSPGISDLEAKTFAQNRFKIYVEKGKASFDTGFPSDALLNFENAILLAQEYKMFHAHLPALYQYARESSHLSGNRGKALQHAEALLKWIEKNKPQSVDHAEALLRMGFLQAQLERFEDSVAKLNQSLQIYEFLNMPSKLIEVLSGLGSIAEQTTDYERALSFFQSAVSLSKTIEKKELLARQHSSMGRIYDLRLSNYISALEHYRKSLSFYEEIKSGRTVTAEIAQAHLDIGRCFRLLGDFTQAEQNYKEALLRIGTESDYPQLYAKILIEQANNAWYQAKYQEAFILQRTSLRIAREKNLPLMEVVSLNTAGLLWWAVGDPQKALAELKDALIRAEQSNIRKDEVATTLNNIGFIYREMGRYPEALKAFDEALAIDEKLKSKWALAYDYRHKGITLMKMEDFSKALPLLIRAFKESQEIGNRVNEARSELDLGDCYLALGNIFEASASYSRALSLSRPMMLREVEWRALYGLARIELTRNPEEARTLLLQAIETIEKIRSDIRLSQLKDTFLTNKLIVYESLCKLLADSGKPAEAFEITERSRSRNFIDLLGNQRLTLNHTAESELYQRRLKLSNRIEEIQIRRSQSRNPSEQSGFDSLLASLNREMDTVMLEVQSRNPQLGSLISVAPLNLPEFIRLIEPNVAFIDYYVLSDEILCWVIRSNGIRLLRIPSKRELLGEKILGYRRRIQNLEPIDDASKALYHQLIAPILPHLDGITILGIIPHGPLHYLSFATLTDGKDYLIDRFSLFYLPSASVFRYTLQKRKPEKLLKVLAIGNPDLGDPAFDLPFSEHEVNSIKWNFPEITILTHERATEKWVVDNIGKFGIIHMASHGEFNPVNPLFSSIKLAKDEERDGNLEAAEIFGITINADLVVLSACQTGLSKVTEGDDIIGLTRAFLYAGTHTLISSLWRISDISTAILIKEFYRQFTLALKADGLRKAALHVKNRYPHPGYWGGLTLVGDYQ